MDFSDLSLIAMVILNNDHRAYGKLVTKYQSEVRSLLIKLTNGDKALADDLAQDVFIRAYKYLKSYKATASFPTWLYRISCNVFLDNCHSNRYKYDFADPDYSEDTSADINASIDLQNALKVLKPVEKIVILMHYQKGFSHSEVSRILRLPLGTVKTHILRAKNKLYKYYRYEEHG